jgi:hypothetical protein
LPAGETAVNGKVASTSYGPVQIQLIKRAGKIVKVAVLVQPTNTLHDVQIGEFAFPKLISETLARRTARSTRCPAPPTPARATSSRCRARSTSAPEAEWARIAAGTPST